MFLDNSDKPKFVNPFDGGSPQDYLTKIGENAKTKLGAMACGSGGEITNVDQDEIGQYQINDPAFCAGKISSLLLQIALLGGFKKGLNNKTPAVKTNPVLEDGQTPVKKPGTSKNNPKNPEEPNIKGGCLVGRAKTPLSDIVLAVVFGVVEVRADCSFDTSTLKKKLDNLNSHLTDLDIQGAKRDLANNPVPKPGGGYYQHLKEVTEAKIGMKNLIKTIKKELDTNPDLTNQEVKDLQNILSQASKKLDQVELEIP